MEGPDDKRGKYPREGRQGRPDPAQEGPVAIGPPKNALGNTHSQCPPIDFRSLPNADVATSILKEIAESFSSEANSNETPIVSFVDTGFLIDPVWDSSVDWSHYRWEAGEMETKFILSEILNEDRL